MADQDSAALAAANALLSRVYVALDVTGERCAMEKQGTYDGGRKSIALQRAGATVFTSVRADSTHGVVIAWGVLGAPPQSRHDQTWEELSYSPDRRRFVAADPDADVVALVVAKVLEVHGQRR